MESYNSLSIRHSKNIDKIQNNIDLYLEKLPGLYMVRKVLLDSVGDEKDIKIVNRKIRYYEKQIVASQNAINFLEKKILELDEKFLRKV